MKGFLLIGFSLIGGSTEIATQKKHVSNHKATLVLAHGPSGWVDHPGLSPRMYLLVSFRKSTPEQNRQLIV